LAGRDGIIERAAVALDRIREGRAARSLILYGLRGRKDRTPQPNSSPVRAADANVATGQALAELDASFFRVRFDRLTPSEKRYMRAMAELGPGPHRSGDVASLLSRNVTSIAPTRSSLIVKGMIYSPAHGDTAFTVPLFDAFMKRIMPTG
jgi:hypothetical protein